MSRDESESSENDSGDEMEEPGPPAVCLFCDQTSDTIEASISHVRSSHSFDVETYLSKNASSTYDLVKIVTYIRSKRPTPSQLQAPGRPWDSEEYLKPVDSEDPWLWTDFEFINDEDLEPKYVNSENGTITLSKGHFDELQKRNQELKLLVEEKDRQMEKLRTLMTEEPEEQPGVDRPGDGSYFSSYSSFEIHREMLGDAPRMDAFRKLFAETELFRGKAVLDVGCGTGILSMMAASAGASRVVGVDDSDIVYSAMEIVHENGFDSTIRLVKTKVECVQLDEKFDFIVSEWMGYFLLFEGMLSSVITARDRFLKEGGLVFPSWCKIWLAGVSDPETRSKRLESEIFGYRMTPLQRAALREATVETVPSEALATEPFPVYHIDVLTASQDDCYFSSDFTLTATRDTELTSLCGWFDSGFEPAPALLTTSPTSEPTHWKQTTFYLEKALPVRQGDRLSGRISVAPTFEGARSLVVTITLQGDKQTYSLA